MRSYELVIDVTGRTDLEGDQHTAATVHVPDTVTGPITVLFGYPGAGYARGYYDIRKLPGYSQADYHTHDGIVVVACDHLGVGASSQPDPFGLTLEAIAAGNHATAVDVIARLAEGSIAEDQPPVEIERVVGMGQSMGGGLLTVQQANHATFDAIAFLGWSGIHTTTPWLDELWEGREMPPRGTDLNVVVAKMAELPVPSVDVLGRWFHWEDEPPELADADMATYAADAGVARGDDETPWGSSSTPLCAMTMTTTGVVADEAAAIDVPVLVACGERDGVPDPWSEPTAYRGSSDVSVFVVPGMAHMHNFARTRELLWERIGHFARAVPPR